MAKRGRKPSKVTIKNFPKSAGSIIVDALEPKATETEKAPTLTELLLALDVAGLRVRDYVQKMFDRI
jgi:hypothetical protein